MFVAYSEKLVRILIRIGKFLFRLVDNLIVDDLNGLRGRRGIRIDASRVFKLTLNNFMTQPLVLGDVPPAQNSEDGSGQKDDAGLRGTTESTKPTSRKSFEG